MAGFPYFRKFEDSWHLAGTPFLNAGRKREARCFSGTPVFCDYQNFFKRKIVLKLNSRKKILKSFKQLLKWRKNGLPEFRQ
jgi:hypothetical protein